MAEKKSFQVYYDYEEHLELLSDEEKGRLLMAMLKYAKTGEVSGLEGATMMAFSFIRLQMDRDDAKYEETCRKNRENGSKGGRPKETEQSSDNPIDITENPKNPTVIQETERLSQEPKKPDTDTDTDINLSSDANASSDCGKPPRETQKKPDDLSVFTGELHLTVKDWFAYKDEKRSKYTPTGRKSLITEIKNNVSKYGEAAVIAVIKQSMGSNYQGITWDKLKAMNAPSRASPAGSIRAPKGKTNRALSYQQRTYEDGELDHLFASFEEGETT